MSNIVLRNVGIFDVENVIQNPYNKIALACDILRTASASQNYFSYVQEYFNFYKDGIMKNKTKYD